MRSGGTPAFDEVGDAVDERARLAGAGAGDDEQRAVAVGRGGGLLVIQLRGEVARRAVHGSLARRIEAGVGGHGGQYRFGRISGEGSAKRSGAAGVVSVRF